MQQWAQIWALKQTRHTESMGCPWSDLGTQLHNHTFPTGMRICGTHPTVAVPFAGCFIPEDVYCSQTSCFRRGAEKHRD